MTKSTAKVPQTTIAASERSIWLTCEISGHIIVTAIGGPPEKPQPADAAISASNPLVTEIADGRESVKTRTCGGE